MDELPISSPISVCVYVLGHLKHVPEPAYYAANGRDVVLIRTSDSFMDREEVLLSDFG